MTVEWLVPHGETRSITTALHTVMVLTRMSPGCISCAMSTGVGDRETVRYTEEWQTEEDLVRRLQADTFTTLSTLIDDATGTARVEFELPRGKRGLEFVEESRRSPQEG